MKVCWKIANMEYVMMQVRWKEMMVIKKKRPDELGIPTYYALTLYGDVEWWPDSKMGMPVVYLDPTERARIDPRL
jgi:hypothetical protein